MRLYLPPDLADRLMVALTRAAHREIGGIMMGEHLAEDTFRVCDLTVQHRGGTFTSFRRLLAGALGPLQRFFADTEHHYRRFNYLGEWHSHPAFVPEPSATDHRTMRDIVDDPAVGANFVVLLIVRLDGEGQIVGTVTVFLPGGQVFQGELIQEARV
jgi:[CysO sulfur-carrier protein]-S-L-cysteine hydrolase